MQFVQAIINFCADIFCVGINLFGYVICLRDVFLYGIVGFIIFYVIYRLFR